MSKKEYTGIAAKEFFQAGLIVYILLALVETFWRGTVSDYFNLNYLLASVVASGLLLVVCGNLAGQLFYKKGAKISFDSVNWVNKYNLRRASRDRPKRKIVVTAPAATKSSRVLSEVVQQNGRDGVQSKKVPKAKRRKPASIDGIVRK